MGFRGRKRSAARISHCKLRLPHARPDAVVVDSDRHRVRYHHQVPSCRPTSACRHCLSRARRRRRHLAAACRASIHCQVVRSQGVLHVSQLQLFPPSLTSRLFLALRSRLLRLVRRHVAAELGEPVLPAEDVPSGRGRVVQRGHRARSSPKAPSRRSVRRRRGASPSPDCPAPASPISGADSSTSISVRDTSRSASGAAHVRLVVADLERDNPLRPDEC